MKSGVSSLNPYAASYVPLFKREADDKNNVFKTTPNYSKSGNESGWSGPLPVPNDYKLKGQPGHGSYGSSSQNPFEMTEKQILDEEFEMDLAYLQMTFPGVSDQSLTDVYLANKGDLEATIDMLSHLESYTVDSSENLPDTLDVGDVTESGCSTECASLKLKEVAGEASGSSSGSSVSAFVT